MQVLASQLHFLANKNAELAIWPLFWPVNCIKIRGHVALLSDPTVYFLYCALINVERAYANSALKNDMEEIIDIFGQRHNRQFYFF